jgi:uncharacterized protein YgbK (DUF1537 family)
MKHILIIADDLTGAADTGAAFADAGFATVIPLGGEVPPPADVVVVSTESRDLDDSAAAAAVRHAVSTYVRDDRKPRWVYKKIDSGLRGHPRAELLALMEVLGEKRAVVAPAFPAEGRTTIGGRQYIDGVPVEASALRTPETPWNLVAVFRNDRDVPVRLLNLGMLRREGREMRRLLSDRVRGIVVADATTDADLWLLANAVIQNRTRVLCGAAGFARQLARALPVVDRSPSSSQHRHGPVLVVAGSRHEATTTQVALLKQTGRPVIALSRAIVDDPAGGIAPLVAELAGHLADGRDVALTTAGLPDSPLGPGHVAGLLARVAAAPGVRDRVGGLVLTGGDVAAAVCAALDAMALRLRGEILPGMPWSIVEGGPAAGVLVATKAGSFGDDAALLTCVERLGERPPAA